MKRRILCPLLSLCLALTAQAGSVRLLSGESYDGKLQFVNNQIVVNAGKNGATSVDLSNVLSAVFQNERSGIARGVMLTNGTVVSGTIAAADALATTSVKLGEAMVPSAAIAWVIYGPIARDKIPSPSKGQTGVILPDDEFFPGTIGEITDKKIAVNSPLFGPQRFAVAAGAKSQIHALVLRDIQSGIGTGHYQVIAKDGSTYIVDAIRSDVDGIIIHDSILGDVKIKNDNLAQIRLSSSQYQYLTTMKPAQVDAPKGVDAASAIQTLTEGDDEESGAILTAPNAAISYAVPQGFTVFSSTVFIPKDAVAGTRYTFAVYGDGRLLSRSSPIAAGDNPQHVRVPIVNTRMIALRVEPVMAGVGGAFGKWAQPILLKP